jgi:hypothetical protein
VGGTCIISTQMGTHNRSVCSLFNDALSVIQTIEHRIMNWKGCVEGSGRGLILRYYSSNCVERRRKTTKTLVGIAGLQPEI